VSAPEEKFPTVKKGTYVLVWLGLLALTGVTVTVAGRHLGRLSTLVALVIAALKAGLVLTYFMHLKYEKELSLFKWIVPGVLALLTLFIVLTYFDVAFR
jgi:cytochrome c oxidase subunit 4